MSSTALNATYKTAVLAVEECPVIVSISPNETTITIAGTFMSATPFVVGQEYILRDDTWSGAVPNSERIKVVSTTGMTATPKSDGLGYAITGTIDVVGYTGGVFTGGVIGTYDSAQGASILTPGIEVAIQCVDFNCRFKTLSDAPKIDFDDEASRFATGDEGRDQAIAGARSAEISFTQKMAWAGDVSTIPTWAKVMRVTGHDIKKHVALTGYGTGVGPSGYADLESLIDDNLFVAGDYFFTADGSDTINGELEVIKGNALITNDSFKVGANRKYQGKAVDPSGYATLALLIAGEGLSTGDMFYSHDGTDTTDSALAAAKALLSSVALAPADSFQVGAGDTAVYLNQTATWSGSGIEFLPSTFANEVTGTVWVFSPENGAAPTQTIYRYRGVHGGNGCSVGVGKIGDVYMMTMKLNAAYVGTEEIPYASARALTAPDTSIPEVMLSNSVTVPARSGGSTVSKAVEISQFSLDFGGVVNPFLDQSTTTGNAYFATQDRDPKFTCNPYHVRKNADDVDYIVSNMVTGQVMVKSALVNPHITIEVPNAQLLSPALASREGYVNTNRTYRCLRNDLGGGRADVAMPDSAMYSILIGVRA